MINRYKKKIEKIDEFLDTIRLFLKQIDIELEEFDQTPKNMQQRALAGLDSDAGKLMEKIRKDVVQFNKTLGFEEEQEVHSVDLAFMIDGTGSMAKVIRMVKEKVDSMVNKLAEIFPSY